MTGAFDDFAALAPIATVATLVDERGILFEPIPDRQLARGEALHVHVVGCVPGAIRANHVHYRQTERLCIVGGEFEVVVRDVSSEAVARVTLTADDALQMTMRPGVAHAFRNVGAETGYLLAYSDTAFDPDDVHPFVLLR